MGLGQPGPEDSERQSPSSPRLAVGRAMLPFAHHSVGCQPWPNLRGKARAGDSLHSAALLSLLPLLPTSALCLCLNCGSCRRTCSHSYLTISRPRACSAKPGQCRALLTIKGIIYTQGVLWQCFWLGSGESRCLPRRSQVSCLVTSVDPSAENLKGL